MYKKISIGISFVILFFLAACQSNPVTVAAEKASLSFTGRGSSAALMLDSVLPGGLAIGIAIDEGIAKSIEEKIKSKYPDFDIASLIKSKLKLAKVKNIQSIVVRTYGFKSALGDDQVSVWLELDVIKSNNNVRINYPNDFASVASASFSLVKNDPETAMNMLTAALERVISEKL